MKHPDVFGALYIMSPCCLAPRDPKQFDVKTEAALARVRTLEEARKLGWGERAQLATAAAWSPDPKNPPLYLDLPMKDGVAPAGRACQMGGERTAGISSTNMPEICAATEPSRSTSATKMG